MLSPASSLDARDYARRIAGEAGPRSASAHRAGAESTAQLLVVDRSQLYDLTPELARRFDSLLSSGDERELAQALSRLGLDGPPAIDDAPLVDPPTHALSLAIAQKCNLGCTYCYAQQGAFGGEPMPMARDVALAAVDMLVDGCATGGRVNLAFLGGEPLANRPLLREATRYAVARAAGRGVEVRFALTTNGTLLTEDDGSFFEEHGFAVTLSIDGSREEHDRLRPWKGGGGSFDRIIERARPLLERQRRMQVSARVTVTPHNLDLEKTLDMLVALGFHSVGFSPLLRAPNGLDQMEPSHLETMLEGLIRCGLAFERHVVRGERYPFQNIVTALQELHRGTHRPYPCGAGAGYLGVSAQGELAACHRFVGDSVGQLGRVDTGIDRARQREWLASRHVHAQEPCRSCWARYLCGGGCHHEVVARGRTACDFIRGWLHYCIEAYGRLRREAPAWFQNAT